MTDLDFLRSTPNLTTLNVSDNPLRHAGEAGRLENLRSLYLWHTRLTSVAGLERATRLEELGLADNDLTRVDPLRSLDRLKLLFLGGNPGLSAEDLNALAGRVSEDYRGPEWKEGGTP